MKLLKTRLFKYIQWFIFLIPFIIWLYIEFFVGTVNTSVDNICFPLSIMFFVTIVARMIICSISNEAKEPRFLLDKDSQCYGCQYYRKREECIQDHVNDDFDYNNGTCDVDCICANGSMNLFNNQLK